MRVMILVRWNAPRATCDERPLLKCRVDRVIIHKNRNSFLGGFGTRASGFRFQVQVEGVSGFGIRVSVFGFRVWGFGLRVLCVGFRVSGFGFRVLGVRFRVSDFGF